MGAKAGWKQQQGKIFYSEVPGSTQHLSSQISYRGEGQKLDQLLENDPWGAILLWKGVSDLSERKLFQSFHARPPSDFKVSFRQTKGKQALQ